MQERRTIAEERLSPAEVLREARQRRLYPYAVSPCCEPQHQARAAATDSLPDDSADESDPADNVDDADTENATSLTAGSVESVAASSHTSDCREVCLLQPRDGVALGILSGHSRFCGSCADTVASLDRGCPICRTPIRMVLRLYG